MGEVVQFSSSRKERFHVRETVRVSMAHDPIARYIAKESHMAAFWDALISVYWSSEPRELHLRTKACKSVVFARYHPEEKVSGIQAVLRDLRTIPTGKLSKLPAAIQLGQKIDRGKADFAREVGPYIYVYVIGTRPECQNRGLGSVLMRHITAIADSKGLPCYLESSSESSRRFYERHGYHVRETVYVDKGAPPLFLMSRLPAPKGMYRNRSRYLALRRAHADSLCARMALLETVRDARTLRFNNSTAS